MTLDEANQLQTTAHMNLLVAGWRLKQRLLAGDVQSANWIDKGTCFLLPYGNKGSGLQVFKTPSFHGIQYCSHMGANSDYSYSGLLPFVTLDEALLLIPKPWKAFIAR